MFVFVFGVSALLLQAQKTVTGTVVSNEDNLPVPGATVMIKGTTLGVNTDPDGRFSITAPEGARLEIRFLGMKTAEVVVDSRSDYNVILYTDLLGVDEVVVVAYGVTKKESYTGAASVVKSDQ